MPEGTPNYVGAAGTIQTCTAQGFMTMMFGLTIAIYYASLSIYSFFAVKNNFRQEKFQWIEKWIHGVACVIPFVLCCFTLANESFNPYGCGCFLANYPLGCEHNSDVECLRGGIESNALLDAFAIGNLLLFLVVPPSALILVACWIRRTSKESPVSVGISQVRAAAQKQMRHDVMKQMSMYLASFWFVYIFSFIGGVTERANNGEPNTDILIISSCCLALQGVIIATVYFTLQKMVNSSQRLPTLLRASVLARRRKGQLTVSVIRNNAETSDSNMVEVGNEPEETDYGRFFIFDGTPSDGSPWAKYFNDQDECDDDKEGFNENGSAALKS